METEKELSPDYNSCSDTKISQDFSSLLKISIDDVKNQENRDVNNHGGDDDEEKEEEEEEFSFMCSGADMSPIAAEDAFINGQIKPVFPLFNRDLLFSAEGSDALHENLPMRLSVKKVFVETREESSQVTSSTLESDGAATAGPNCQWSTGKAVEASPEICKKSNSTGFSKIWRFKDFLGRSNSDGRDAFVFLNNSHAPPPPAAEQSSSEKFEKKEPTAKKAKKGGKGKTASLSAHEVYLKSKAKEEERRRSYLPYRPELMGFFTNVNGGLSKNVHPF